MKNVDAGLALLTFPFHTVVPTPPPFLPFPPPDFQFFHFSILPFDLNPRLFSSTSTDSQSVVVVGDILHSLKVVRVLACLEGLGEVSHRIPDGT